tara:strand:+ start:150 stop:2525 length:2376 start_codon:yes stop_codon:yes gene_type:complete
MPSGRLGRCIIEGRTGVELYVNSSGSEASVTIQTQVISTTANVEQTVVVGVAATTLKASTIVATSPVGTYTSMRGLNYSCWQTGAPDENKVGVSTIQGAFRTPICCAPSGSNIMEGTYCDVGSGSLRYIDPNSGNQTFAIHNTCMCGACTVPGGYPFRCCFRGEYGGNELQNPLIWLMQENNDDHPGGKYGYPNNCGCCNWFWGDQIIGWNPGNHLAGASMCCPNNISCMPADNGHILRAPQVIGCTTSPATNRGVGIFKTDLAITAMQMYIQPCCCCGYTAANTWPVARFDANGCSNSQSCCGGPPCNYAYCKYKIYWCCHQGSQNACGKILGFNWYTLCRNGHCCCQQTGGFDADWMNRVCSDSNGGITTPGGNYTTSAGATICCCYPCHKCGTLMGPMMIQIRYCGSEWCTCCGLFTGTNVLVCGCYNSSECGLWYTEHLWNGGLCSCHCAYYELHQMFNHKYKCPCAYYYCERNRGRGGGSNQTYIMHPYGFSHGMTNCMFVHHYENNSSGRHTYFVGWPNAYISGGGCRTRCNCEQMGSKTMFILVCESADKSRWNEWPIKYVAWNPFDCYVYMGIRSADDAACGIFRWDADKLRKWSGPHCGCATYADGRENTCAGCYCGGFNFCMSLTPTEWADQGLDVCKVADFPACWTQSKYKTVSFCVSCLFRSERCIWLMDVYNHSSGKWDSYSTKNLYDWDLVNDSDGTTPFKLKVSNTLSINGTTDCACIITTCNCFMSNIDCTGLIDWCFSANQYERNGIVLSNGDRVMINNNSDEKVNAQIWGYEG